MLMYVHVHNIYYVCMCLNYVKYVQYEICVNKSFKKIQLTKYSRIIRMVDTILINTYKGGFEIPWNGPITA